MRWQTWAVLSALAVASGCTCGNPGDPDGGTGGGSAAGGGSAVDGGLTGRCDTELTRFMTAARGNVHVKQAMAASDLLQGPNAVGRVGDFVFSNGNIKVVIQGDGRLFGPQPFGGTIIDADIVRQDGTTRDQFGEIGLLYNFGRTIRPEKFEILNDGANGEPAVLAVTGSDTANDYLSIRNKLAESLGRVPLADPFIAQPLKLTNYFILNSGESRIRFVTAFCNTSNTSTLQLAVGDLTDPGYVLEFFNPLSCTGGFGYGGLCFGLDRMNWYGYQGDQVAYGYAPYQPGSPLIPATQNATLTIAGITGSILGANGISGLVSWINPSDNPREGEIRLPPMGSSTLARDFWVSTDLGTISNLIEQGRSSLTGNSLGDVSGLVKSSGAPLEGARVAFESDSGQIVLTTGPDGRYSGKLPIRNWKASAWSPGRNPTAKKMLTTSVAAAQVADFDLVDPRPLTVTVREVGGGPMPAKVTVLCASGACNPPVRTFGLYNDQPKDPYPDAVRQIAYVPAAGTVTINLPPEQYLVLVSRGPEYSIFPNTYPTVPGLAVDLRTQSQTVNAVLAHVVDTTGWMSADFHVHAVNSPDSTVDNLSRVMSFAGDGVDVVVSTDHDYVTDFGPVIAAAGLSPFLATVVGEEMSPMEFGHYNIFPLVADATNLSNGGAVDWAGGDLPALTIADMFVAARTKGATTVHFNHPRGLLGGLTAVRADTDTFASHTDPLSLAMAAQPGATADDTKILSMNFNALELLNPGEDNFDALSGASRSRFNDWFTLISRGFKIAGTGVSDTHTKALGTGWRTFVNMGSDSTTNFVPVLMSTNLNAMKAIASNGPFVNVTAYRVDTGGAMVTTPVGIGGTVGPDTRDLGITVDIQLPEYLDVTKVELYMHKAQDDAACPVDPQSPRAATTRVACDGKSNVNWPASGITATQAVALTPGDLETAVTANGVTYKRYHKVVNFRVPAPTKDNWVIVIAQGSKTMAPLNWATPGSSGSSPATYPFAITNPILIDADATPGYQGPFDPTGMALPGGPKKYVHQPRPAPADEAEMIQRWGELKGD